MLVYGVEQTCLDCIRAGATTTNQDILLLIGKSQRELIEMGDAHVPITDPHMQAVPTLFPQHTSLDPLHDHDFSGAEFDGGAHHSLSPLSMNHMPGTLSRPASMASMTLPPGQTLSRVGSLSNLHQPWQPSFYPLYIASGFSVPQGQTQQIHLAGPQQTYTPAQYSAMQQTAFTLPHSLLFNDYIPVAAQTQLPQQNTVTKPTKKSKAKRAANGDSDSPSESSTKGSKNQRLTTKPSSSTDNDNVPKQVRSRSPSSVYRGVSKCSKDGRWQARIRVKRNVTYLGRFVNEIDAAKRYDEAARLHHGDKAVLNFPTDADKQLGRKQAVSTPGEGDDDNDEEDSE